MTSFRADSTLANAGQLEQALKTAGWKVETAAKSGRAAEPLYKIYTRVIDNPLKAKTSIRGNVTQNAISGGQNGSSCNSDHPLLHDGVEKSPKNGDKNTGSNSPMGAQIQTLTPNSQMVLGAVGGVAPVSKLEDITSISRMRLNVDSFVIAYDSEFYYDSTGERLILTWQFVFVLPDLPDKIQEVVFCSVGGERLTLEYMLSWVLSRYSLDGIFGNADFHAYDFKSTRRWVYHIERQNKDGSLSLKSYLAKSLDEAISKSKCVVRWDSPERDVFIRNTGIPVYSDNLGSFVWESDLLKTLRHKDVRNNWVYQKAEPNKTAPNGIKFVDYSGFVNGYVNDFCEFNKYALPVTLLCHAGKADITALEQDFTDVLPKLSDVQGGLVTLTEFYIHSTAFEQYWKFYPLVTCVRDTMCFAPAKQKKLANLGDTIGVQKLDVSAADKNNMLGYLLREPVNFMEYAINDSVITLLYAAELWGYNKAMPVTVSGAAVKAAVPVICEYFGFFYDDSKTAREQYNMTFRGLHTVKKGLSTIPDKAAFLENTALEPVSDNARILQTYAKQAYKGGYNGSSKIGYFTEPTFDYDLENAYPTCMSLVPDVNWDGAVIANEIVRRKIIRQDFHTPFDLMFGYVKFKFPDSVKYPCIPVSVNGSMVFPRSSDGLNGVYASAPEIYLALCLGAEVYAEHVYIGEFRYNSDGTVSRSLLAAVQQFVTDRDLAKQSFGKKSLPDNLLKTAVNSLYGKTAQDLIDKETWNAFLDKMENIGGSALTSPTHACLTTAGVRCCLLAAMNQLHNIGYDVYSVTTDGFISNAPENVVTGLDLYGFAALFQAARVALVNDPTMWAVKHHQNDLLNITTRGNVSLSPDGVCAHNSFVTGFIPDSYEDRLAFMTAVLDRNGRITCHNSTWTKFRQLAARDKRQDFSVRTQDRALSMDFDMKRKPVKSSFSTVYPVIENQQFEIANFDTEPYETVSEYEHYKNAAKSSVVLRTAANWDLFFAKVSGVKTGQRHITDLDWSILFTCIMGYRLGLWDIPYLNTKGLSVADKVAWINKFNNSKKQFTETDWKNSRRQNRQSQMIDSSLIQNMLQAMQAE